MTDAGVPFVQTISALRVQIRLWKEQGLKVAMVPTMGALHIGHQSLIRQGAILADRVVTSVFVNPIQFGPKEDFTAYPRQPENDLRAIAEAGGHLAFFPSAAEMYPDGFATTVTVSGLSSGLCGDRRPGHFAGVATVVAKLLMQCQPDVALFGEKDYQQLLVIKRMVRDLDIPVDIVGTQIIRDSDGLALSSRNAYLSPEERVIAPMLRRLLGEAAHRIESGDPVPLVLSQTVPHLLEAGFSQIDYLELRDAETLAPVETPSRDSRLLVAAFLGKTRLIDNIAISAVTAA